MAEILLGRVYRADAAGESVAGDHGERHGAVYCAAFCGVVMLCCICFSLGFYFEVLVDIEIESTTTLTVMIVFRSACGCISLSLTW